VSRAPAGYPSRVTKQSKQPLDTATRIALADHVKSAGLARTARSIGVAHATLTRAIRGESVSTDAIKRLARIAPRVRTAEEFKRLAAEATAPRKQAPTTSWSLASIRSARDAQLRGDFALPVRLAEAMRTDDAIFTARQNRLDPHNAIATRLVAAPGARGLTAANLAAQSVHVARTTLEGIHATLVDHGIAIGYVLHEPNDDGTRVDVRLTQWPLESVYVDTARGALLARVQGAPPVEIVHGDGRWIVFRRVDDRPWTHGACVLPASFVWAAHAESIADWNSSSHAHGMARAIAEMPEGFALTNADGNPTPETQAILEMIRDVMSGDAPAGVLPGGAKLGFSYNGSTAWQVFAELVGSRERAAARIYLGTDAVLGSNGSAPGVDVETLFGVAATKLQGDLAAIQDGLASGLYAPWCAINLGSSRYAPRLEYQIPDPDADAKREQQAKNRERLFAAVDRMRALGFVVDDAAVAALAALYAVEPVPTLAAAGQQAARTELAPTDAAWTVSVNEVRAQDGRGPLLLADGTPDPDGALPVAAYRAKREAAAAATATPPPSATV